MHRHFIAQSTGIHKTVSQSNQKLFDGIKNCCSRKSCFWRLEFPKMNPAEFFCFYWKTFRRKRIWRNVSILFFAKNCRRQRKNFSKRFIIWEDPGKSWSLACSFSCIKKFNIKHFKENWKTGRRKLLQEVERVKENAVKLDRIEEEMLLRKTLERLRKWNRE